MKNITSPLSKEKACSFPGHIHIFCLAILIRVMRNVDVSWFMQRCARDCQKKHTKKRCKQNTKPSNVHRMLPLLCIYNYTRESTAWQVTIFVTRLFERGDVTFAWLFRFKRNIAPWVIFRRIIFLVLPVYICIYVYTAKGYIYISSKVDALICKCIGSPSENTHLVATACFFSPLNFRL